MFYLWVRGADALFMSPLEPVEWSSYLCQVKRRLTKTQYRRLKSRVGLVRSTFPDVQASLADVRACLINLASAYPNFESRIAELHQFCEAIGQYKMHLPADILKEMIIDIVADRHKVQWLWFKSHLLTVIKASNFTLTKDDYFAQYLAVLKVLVSQPSVSKVEYGVRKLIDLFAGTEFFSHSVIKIYQVCLEHSSQIPSLLSHLIFIRNIFPYTSFSEAQVLRMLNDSAKLIQCPNSKTLVKKVRKQMQSEKSHLLLSGGHIVYRFHTLVHTPSGSPFAALIDFVDFEKREAITAQKDIITETFKKLVEAREFSLEPKISWEETVFSLNNWIQNRCAQKKNTSQKMFWLTRAEMGLKLLQGDDKMPRHPVAESVTEYQYYDGHPEIRDLYRLAFQLSNITPPQDFVKVWIYENPDAVKRQFRAEDAIDAFTVRNPEVIEQLALLIIGDDQACIPRQVYHKYIPKLVNAYYEGQNLMPLVDVLFMIMRGHNPMLEDEDAPDLPACPEGAWLAIMKVVCDLLEPGSIEAKVLTVRVIECGRDN